MIFVYWIYSVESIEKHLGFTFLAKPFYTLLLKVLKGNMDFVSRGIKSNREPASRRKHAVGLQRC